MKKIQRGRLCARAARKGGVAKKKRGKKKRRTFASLTVGGVERKTNGSKKDETDGKATYTKPQSRGGGRERQPEKSLGVEIYRVEIFYERL